MITATLSDLPAHDGDFQRTVILREITASEELEATAAPVLLAMLHVGGTVSIEEMNLSEQDMAIAALYRSLFGESIECHVPCNRCDRKFETQFELADWITALRQGPEVIRSGPNRFRVSATSFRLPVPADLAELEALPIADRAAQLRSRCVLEGDPDTPELEAAMMRAGPLLDDDIEATCPHCNHEQTFPLRLEAYLMAALARERPVVLREIHHIAMAYQWSRNEILSLPRSIRREHVQLILSDRKSRGRVAWH